VSGSWVELTSSWYEPAHRTCPVCGRLVTRRAWRFVDGGPAIDVCSPQCEILYRDYYLPTHGPLGNDVA